MNAILMFLENLSDIGLLVIRLIAAVGGFIVGYMLTGPVWRVLWRVVRRKPVPPGLLPWLKVCTGLVLAAVLFAVVGIGGGRGWGWGPGGGGGPGTEKGAGDGTGTGVPTAVSPNKKKADGPAAKTKGREVFLVELVRSDRYPGEERYYLLGRKEPPVALPELDAIFQKRGNEIELHVIRTLNSIGEFHPAAKRLRNLATERRVPIVETVEGDEKAP